LTISGKEIKLKDIVAILNKYCSSVTLKRFDQANDGFLEVSFLVDFDSFIRLEKTKEDLNALSKTASITYLDKSGLN